MLATKNYTYRALSYRDAHSKVMLRKAIVKETLFCYLFNLCVRGDLVDPSDTFTIMLNQK